MLVTDSDCAVKIDEATKNRALAAVHAIADDLVVCAGRKAMSPYLATGDAGLALFFFHYGAAFDSTQHTRLAYALIERATLATAAAPSPAALYNGFLGVAWVADHMTKASVENSAGVDPNEQVDAALLHLLRASKWTDFELMNGLLGAGVYALQRGSARVAFAPLLERVLDQLEATSQTDSEGRFWFTPPACLPPDAKAVFPDGYVNLGLAHGCPGATAFLSRVVCDGHGTPCVKAMLAEATQWLRAQAMSGGEVFPSEYPPWIAPDLAREPSRLAWCYGDLSAATAMVAAGQALTNADVEAAGIALARRAADRSLGLAQVVDACLCHGAIGVALMYHRLAERTGLPALAEAALRWLLVGLDCRTAGQGIGGFFARVWNEDAMVDRAETGLLNGGAGVGLGLLALAMPGRSNWSHLMLL